MRSLACPLNSEEIVIIGGEYKINRSNLTQYSDIIIYEVATDSCKRVSIGGELKFGNFGNQSIQVSENRVVAMVS